MNIKWSWDVYMCVCVCVNLFWSSFLISITYTSSGSWTHDFILHLVLARGGSAIWALAHWHKLSFVVNQNKASIVVTCILLLSIGSYPLSLSYSWWEMHKCYWFAITWCAWRLILIQWSPWCTLLGRICVTLPLGSYCSSISYFLKEFCLL